MKRSLTLVIAGALLAVNLGACSKSEPEPAPVEEQAAAVAETPSPLPTATPEVEAPIAATTATTDANTAVEVPPEVAAAPDEQMMDDASATGLTARASRGDQPSNEATTTEPPEEK